MTEDVIFDFSGHTLTARLSCEIDHHTAKGIRERIDHELFLKKPDVLCMDFSGVGFMDSSGIAMILGRAETCKVLGSVLTLKGLSAELFRIVRLSGIEKSKNISVLNERGML